MGDEGGVVVSGCCDGGEEERDRGAAFGFDGDADKVEPLLVERAGEGCVGGEVGEGEGVVEEERFVVPEHETGVGGDGREVEVGADL